MKPRRAALLHLRAMGSNLRCMLGTWDWTPRQAKWRPVDPEQDKAEWQRLALYMEAIRRQAESLRDYAEEQAK